MMKSSIRLSILAAICVLLISSCTAYKKIPYVQDAASLSQSDLAKVALNYEAKVMPNDVLLITVNTPTPSAAKDFNLPLVPSGSEDIAPSQIVLTGEGNGSLQNYIVDKNGNINFPVLGKIKVGGLTRPEIEKMIHDMVYPKYLKEDPVVNTRFLNYHVSVLGEVNRPGIYTSQTARMTIFDAIASAQDLTIYGKRENVLLIRQDEKGEKHILNINLQDKNILLNNEIYYLQQNDVVYVEPNHTKGNNSKIGSVEGLALSGISLLVSVISIIISRL